ncbi:MAG TPA: TIGR00725 family protein [Acidimicrobiales bacterium]|nr:TIGR00725 family protein [Acidimicrobiales bacterium]
MADDRLYVAVSGGGEAGEGACRVAEDVGRELARRGAVVLTGGLGGVMEAASRGAKAAGGLTIGLLPSEDRADANPWVDVAVPTGMGEGRNVLLVRAADAVVAVAGEFGTLSEIALALRLGKPVVGLGTWELARDGRAVEAVVAAATAEEAAERAVALARGRRARPTGW